jgi:hypothetical protein
MLKLSTLSVWLAWILWFDLGLEVPSRDIMSCFLNFIFTLFIEIKK